MKKISLKDIKIGLKRDEMRMIFGGSGGSNGGSGNPGGPILSGCVSDCSNDSDCNCRNCVGASQPYPMYCGSFSCRTPGTHRKSCTC